MTLRCGFKTTPVQNGTAKIAHIQIDFDIVDASIAMLVALTLSAVGAGCTRLWVDQPKTETALGTA